MEPPVWYGDELKYRNERNEWVYKKMTTSSGFVAMVSIGLVFSDRAEMHE